MKANQVFYRFTEKAGAGYGCYANGFGHPLAEL